MKHRKLFALVLALSLALVGALPAFAVDTSGAAGSITIRPPANGSLSLDAGAFYAYKLFDLININVEGTYDLATGAVTPYTPFDPDVNNSLGDLTSAHFVYKPVDWLADFLAWANANRGRTYDTNPELFRKWLQGFGQLDDSEESVDITHAVLALAQDLAIYEKTAGLTKLTPSKVGDNLVFSTVPFGYYIVLGTGKRALDIAPNKSVYDIYDNDDTVVTRGMLVNVPEEEFGTGANAGKVVKLNKAACRVLKADAPDLDKQVQDDEKNDKYDPALTDPWGERAEHDIGELYSYRITVTIPSDYSLKGYDLNSYIFKIYDKMSEGITLEKAGATFAASDIVITRSPGTARELTLVAGTHFSLTSSANPDSFVVTISPSAFADKTIREGDTIVLVYQARLNEKAVIDGPNINTAYLEYSNDPNWDGKGTQPTGETPEDETEVYTFNIHIKKVDGEDDATLLAGATFQLSSNKRTNGVDAEDAVIKFVKVDDFTYRVPAATETTGLVDKMTTVVKGDLKDGTLSFLGLDEGIYWLRELQAPVGYNLLENPIKIRIDSEGRVYFLDIDEDLIAAGKQAAEKAFEDKSIDVSMSSDNFIMIQNHTGGTLPGTGGIGIYVILGIGGLMAILLAVAFVVYRRKKTLGLLKA